MEYIEYPPAFDGVHVSGHQDAAPLIFQAHAEIKRMYEDIPHLSKYVIMTLMCNFG